MFENYKHRLTKNGAEIIDGEASEVFFELREKMIVRGKIKLVVCKEASGPMIMGFLKPVLVAGRRIFPPRANTLQKKGFVVQTAVCACGFGTLVQPSGWLMRRRADVDMELSVDEEVVGQSGFDVRKAYTEVLFSTIGKSRSAPNALTTHFSGSKKVIKKRFYNILTRINRFSRKATAAEWSTTFCITRFANP